MRPEVQITKAGKCQIRPGGKSVPDWKYHVTSLVAVFLALGIGIVVGSMVVGEKAVLDQQRSMLAKLEGDLAALREANVRLRGEAEEARREVEETRAVAGRVLPALVAGRLEGVNVVVVTDGQAAGDGLLKMLAQAGARVSSSTALRLQDFPWPALAALAGAKDGPPWVRTAQVLGEGLGRAIALGSDGMGDLLERGAKEGWLARKGEYGRGTGILVVLESGQEKTDKAAAAVFLSLARYWRENWGPVVAATAADAAVLRPYEEVGAVTVGNIADLWAQAAVVAALTPRR